MMQMNSVMRKPFSFFSFVDSSVLRRGVQLLKRRFAVRIELDVWKSECKSFFVSGSAGTPFPKRFERIGKGGMTAFSFCLCGSLLTHGGADVIIHQRLVCVHNMYTNIEKTNNYTDVSAWLS